MNYLVDENGKIYGYTEHPELYSGSVPGPIKPLRPGEEVTYNKDSKKWEYSFQQYTKKDVPDTIKIYLSKLTDIERNTLIQQCLFGFISSIQRNAAIKMPEDFITGTKYHYKDTDTIDVLIPCYGKARYIKYVVNAFMHQKLMPRKIIILLMDDDSIALKEELESMGAIIECIVHEQMYAGQARNYLATLSDADWLAFNDADDIPASYYIEDLLTGEETNSYNAAVRTGFKKLYDSNEFINNPKSADEIINDTDDIISYRKLISINSGTFICHRDVFDDYQFDEQFYAAFEDIDLFYRINQDCKYTIAACLNHLTYVFLDNTDMKHNRDENLLNVIKNIQQYIIKHKKTLLENLDTYKVFDYKYMYMLLTKYINIFERIENLDSFTDELIFEIILLHQNICIEQKREIIENSIYNYLTSSFEKSREREPLGTYSSGDFTIIGELPENFSFDNIEGLAFDVLMFNDITDSNISSLLTDEGTLIINNKCLEEIQKLEDYTWLDKTAYLLDHYCVLTLGNKPYYECTIHKTSDMIALLESCMYIRENISVIDDIIDSFKAKTYVNKKLLATNDMIYRVSFMITNECNYSCTYCSKKSACSGVKETRTDDEIYETFDKALTTAEQVFGKKYLYPSIIGGEPTLLSYKLQERILKRLQGYHGIAVYTNGRDMSSPFVKHPEMYKYMHALDFEDIFNKYLIESPEYYEYSMQVIYVLTHDKVDSFISWAKNNSEKINKYAMCIAFNVCNYTDNAPELACTKEDYLKLQELKELGINARGTLDMSMPNNIDIKVKYCYKNKPPIDVDCTNNKLYACCHSVKPIEYSAENLKNLADVIDKEQCATCLNPMAIMDVIGD